MTNSTTHCSLCLSTDHEDLHTGDQGYTACCNEPLSDEAIITDTDADLDAEAFQMYRTLVKCFDSNPYRVVADRYFDGNFTAAIAGIDRHCAR